MAAELTDRSCPVCWNKFTPTTYNPAQRYCTSACRVEDWRRQHRDAQTPPSPSRDDPETTRNADTCPLCHRPFNRTGRQRYCSDTCRKTAWRRRHSPAPTAPTTVPPGQRRREHTIYACPNCDTRYLAEQRCPDCNLWCQRVGLGGPCPHCDEPVTLTDLLNTNTTTQERP